MSTSFTLWRISPWLAAQIEQFGILAFDAFWEASWLDDDKDTWTETEAEEWFEPDEYDYMSHVLGDVFIPILNESRKIHLSKNEAINFDGRFMEGMHFLFTGKRQFYPRDFLVKEIFPRPDEHEIQPITLVNALLGCRLLKRELGLEVNYFCPHEIKVVCQTVPKVLEQDLDTRWKILQDLDIGFNYHSSESANWNDQTLEAHREYIKFLDRYHSRSFSEFFKPGAPKHFAENVLLPFLKKTVERGCGILSTRTY